MDVLFVSDLKLTVYTMQTASLPKRICDDIESLYGRFVWADTEASRKTRLIKWDAICQPTAYGGLGVKKIHPSNDAFLMKLGWGLLTEVDSFWGKVVKDKYKVGGALLPHLSCSSRASALWRGIFRIWPEVLNKGCQMHSWLGGQA